MSHTARLAVAAPVVAILLGGVSFLLLRADPLEARPGAERVGLASGSAERTAPLTRSAACERSREATRLSAPGGSNAFSRETTRGEAVSHALVAASQIKPAATLVVEGTREGAARGAKQASASDLAWIRAALRDSDPKARLAALRAARDLHAPELENDAARDLANEPSVACRRVATQILAQGDAAAFEPLLRMELKELDPVVQLNATFGLARAGDESQQAVLLIQCEVSRQKTPALVPYVATMLEDPALRSAAVVERFRQLSQNPAVTAETRARAIEVLRAKGA